MAVSAECIAAVRAASGDSLSTEDATALIQRMEARRKAFEAAGNIDNLEGRLRAAAEADATSAQIVARVAQKHAALAAIAYDGALRHIETLRAAGLDRRKALLALAEGTTRLADGGRSSIAATAMAYRARYMEAFNLAMVRDPEVARLVQNGDQGFSRAVVREMRELRPDGQPGITGNQQALALAKTYADIGNTLIRPDLNRLGATIGDLAGWSPQAHDAGRVARATFDEWRDVILPRLDRERTFGDMEDGQIADMLRGIHQEIVTGVQRQPSAAELGQRAGPANLANRLSHSRTLHFADASGWIQYAERFGQPNIHAAMIGHIQHAAKMAGQMEKLGPNPTATWNRLLATAQRDAAADPALSPTERASQAQALNPMRTNGSLYSAWAEFSGLTASPGNIRWAEIGTGIRAWMSMSKLAGAAISQIGDLSNRQSALIHQGMPIGRAIAENAGEIAHGRGTGELREIGALLDAGLDGLTGRMVTSGMAEDMPLGTMHRWTERLFRWQGMTYMADAAKSGAARMISRWMGFHADTVHAALPERYRHVLRQHGIGAEEWEVFRKLTRQAEDGNRYVTPDLVRGIPRDELARLAQPELEAMQAGGADRALRRERANLQEAGWVRRRTDKLAEDVQRGLASLQRVNRGSEAAADRHIGRVRDRMTELQTRLSELAEFHDAMAEGRAWSPATPEALTQRPFTPVAERHLDVGGPEILAARAEGELRARLDALRRSVGAIKRELSQTETTRLREMLSWWNERDNELSQFTQRVESRADIRKAATAAEEAGWQGRVDRILDAKRDDLEITLRRFFADEIGSAYIEPDAASRRLSLHGSQPGTVTGELMRFIMQFKSYPIAFTNRVLGRHLHGYSPEERLLQGRNIGVLIAGLTITGLVSLTIKDAVLGYGPRDWSKPANWIAAAKQGGGMGVYGDFLFAQASRFNNTLLETVAGPAPGAVANVGNWFLKAKAGDAGAGEALNVMLQNTPFINLWYARPALDLLILNATREALAPGFIQRQQRRRFDDYGQRPLGASFQAFQ